MKKILMASAVAAVAGSSAFAGSGASAINTALDKIDQAYSAVGQTTPTAIDGYVKDILFLVDNDGAVNNIEFGDVSVTGGQVTIGGLTPTYNNFSTNDSDGNGNSSIKVKTDAFTAKIGSDFYGAAAADESSWGLTESPAGTWTVTGITGGFIKSELDTFAGLATDVETAVTEGNVNLWTEANLGTLNTEVEELADAASILNQKSTDIKAAHDTDWSALEHRTGTEGEVNLVDAAGSLVATVLSEVAETTYDSLVDDHSYTPTAYTAD